MTTTQAVVVLSIALQLGTLSAIVTYFTLQHRQLAVRDLAQSRTTQALDILQNHLETHPVRSVVSTKVPGKMTDKSVEMTGVLRHRTQGQLWMFEANPSKQRLKADLPKRLGQVQRLEFRGQPSYSQVQPWSDRSGKTWHMASFVLEDDLQKVVSKADRIKFLLAGAGFLTAIGLGFLSGRQLTMRLRQSLTQLESLQRLNDERFQRLMTNVPGVIYRAIRQDDGIDRITYISSRCGEMYEMSAEQVVNDLQVLSKLIAPEKIKTFQHLADRAIETLSPWRMEYRIQMPSGQVKWLEIAASPDVMKDGTIAWDGMILDMSDRHRADDLVKRYRNTLKATVKKRTAELEAANHELSLMVKIDGLTQIANRRHFDQHLSDNWKRLARSKQPLSLIMCDVDYFKRFNDSYGHPEGDKVLENIAAILKQVAKRPDDLPARYGGEEFAIILPNTDLIGAMQVAEKIRQDVLALRINHIGSSVNAFVTLSLGIATVTPNEIAESVRSPQDLILIADRALYQAKHGGRNRSHVQDSRCLKPSQT